MDRDLRFVLVACLALAVSLLLESTVLHTLAIGGVKPDLALIVLVFVAVQGGSMLGEVCGFASGLMQDLLSLPPLGLHALVRTLLGALCGRLQGTFASTSVLGSALLAVGATAAKGILIWMTAGLLAPAVRPHLTAASAIELAYNGLMAPLLFAGLSRIKALRRVQEREELA